MMRRLYFLCSLFLVLGTLLSCGSEDEFVIDDGSANNTDVAVTGLVDEYGATYAFISGYVNLQLLTSVGSNPTIGIEMSEVKVTEEGETLHNTRTESTSELIGKRFFVNFIGLSGKCQYKYRSFVKAGGITYYGGYRDFSTTDFANLTTTGQVSDITFTSVSITSDIDVDSIKPKESISIGLAYTTNKSKLHPDSTFIVKYFSLDNLEEGTYKINLDNLLTGKTYYYASFTKAGRSLKLGLVKSFTTKSLNGYLETGEATDVSSHTACIKGTSSLASFYPQGAKITYGVRYAISEEALGGSNYFTSTANISNTSSNNLTANLSGLSAGQTYYYYVYANVDGVLLTGNVKSFTTSLPGQVYVGAYEVYLPDGTLSKNGKSQIMRLIKGENSDTLYMDHIRFTDKVHYAFDIRFDGIKLMEDGKTLKLTSATRVPEMIWKKEWVMMPQYTISGFSGRFTADSLYLDFKCGENILTYAGKHCTK